MCESLRSLLIALQTGYTTATRALLKTGADPKARLPVRDRVTLFMQVAANDVRRRDNVRALLKAGGRIEERDDKTRTPLTHTAQGGNVR
jgi:hypothetical protein